MATTRKFPMLARIALALALVVFLVGAGLFLLSGPFGGPDCNSPEMQSALRAFYGSDAGATGMLYSVDAGNGYRATLDVRRCLTTEVVRNGPPPSLPVAPVVVPPVVISPVPVIVSPVVVVRPVVVSPPSGGGNTPITTAPTTTTTTTTVPQETPTTTTTATTVPQETPTTTEGGPPPDADS